MQENSQERYWFKNKKVGIGWTPATWEGWGVVGLYVLGLVFLAQTTFVEPPQIKKFVSGIVVLTFLLTTISYKFGEPLNYRFWKKNQDK